MNFGHERRSRHDVLVEGDVDRVVGRLERYEAHGEASGPLRMDLETKVWNVTSKVLTCIMLGLTWVGMFLPRALMVISRLPSPALEASTVNSRLLPIVPHGIGDTMTLPESKALPETNRDKCMLRRAHFGASVDPYDAPVKGVPPTGTLLYSTPTM